MGQLKRRVTIDSAKRGIIVKLPASAKHIGDLIGAGGVLSLPAFPYPHRLSDSRYTKTNPMNGLENCGRLFLIDPQYPAQMIFQLAAGTCPRKVCMVFYGSELTYWQVREQVLRDEEPAKLKKS